MSNLDFKITELFAEVQKQRTNVEEIEKSEQSKWKTSCSLHELQNTPINIQTLTAERVVEVATVLVARQRDQKEACNLLGVTFNDKISGSTYNDWFDDLKKRHNIISLREKKALLTSLEKRLDLVLSPEKRREMEIEQISKSLQNA